MDTKHEALEYAIRLEEAAGDLYLFDDNLGRDAATVLRSQHARIEEVERGLSQLRDAYLGTSVEVQADAMRNARALLTKKD